MYDTLMRFEDFNKLIFSGLIQFLEVFRRLVVKKGVELQNNILDHRFYRLDGFTLIFDILVRTMICRNEDNFMIF
ncbi:hypothetical protein LV89_02984 [Arcicella aurantiaca]|uniref:Uncharacterized protein n=1 Tax=Arcicella aurantiaca TaxID=591202 RepID=A0A316E258_9BACT|nr:hypothetical protein LV89_02984 [Arcicella aurantiaca]